MSSSPVDQERYEEILALIVGLAPAPDARHRRLEWLDRAHHLAVARDESRRLEIFLPGAPLSCANPIVRANLSHTEWEWHEPGPFPASRLVLPAEPHFDAVAAFLCTFLIDAGVSNDVAAGFARSEPVIALALERSRILGETLVGLWGELVVMRALLAAAPDRAEAIVDGWMGHGRTTRDFRLGGVGLEVKTTKGNQSFHHVSGARQVQRATGAGDDEIALFLVSVGVADSRAGAVNSWTLPALIDDVLSLIRGAAGGAGEELSQRLLTHVRDYGAGAGQPYNHAEMKDRIVYSQVWRATFVRWYDMDDPLVDVPSLEELSAYSMIDPDSVEFTVRLPRQVDGDLNPSVGLRAGAERVRDVAWPDG
jgi:hypothetical protein